MNRYVLRLEGSMDTAMQRGIESTGAAISFYDDYLPDTVFVKSDSSIPLKALPFVTNVRPVRKGVLLGKHKSHVDPLKVRPRPHVETEQLTALGLYGLGAKVAILDSGYEGRVADSINFSPAQSAEDTYGHGALVHAVFRHVAPAAKIYTAKVATTEDDVDEQSVAQALKWVRSMGDVHIINMSLGFPGRCEGVCDLSRIVNKMSTDGYIITTAAGNNPNTVCKCPGCAEGVITVGSLDMSGHDVAPFSSPGHPNSSKPDLLTSGNGLLIFNDEPDTYSGTSFAAPVVAGIAAALYTRITHRLKFKEYLLQSCDPLEEVSVLRQGNGRLNLKRLLEVVMHEQQIDAVDQ